MLKIIKNYQVDLIDFKKRDINKIYLSWLNNKKLMKYSEQRFQVYDYNKALEYFNQITKKTDSIEFSDRNKISA